MQTAVNSDCLYEDPEGAELGRFVKNGNVVVLKGDIMPPEQFDEVDDEKVFTVQNSSCVDVAVVTTSGDLYLAGNVYENQDGQQDFAEEAAGVGLVIKSDSGEREGECEGEVEGVTEPRVQSFIDEDGNLKARGEVIVKGVPYTLDLQHGSGAEGEDQDPYNWKSEKNMDSGMYSHRCACAIATILILNVLYSAGRCYGEDVTTPTRTYAWYQATAAAEWPPRSGHAVVFFHGKLWLLAGSSDLADGRLNDVWSSADGVIWTQVTAEAPWARRAGHSALDFRDKLWVLDGGGPVNFYRDVWCSNDGMLWENTITEAVWSSRAAPVVKYNNQMYLVGGYEPLQTLADVWTSPDGSNWTRVVDEAPWTSRSAQRPVVFLGQLWVTGGWHYESDIETGYLNDVWSTSDGAAWTEATASAGWHSRSGHAAAAFDDQLWVFGGHYTVGTGFDAYTVLLNDVWASADGTDWRQLPKPAWAPRYGHSAVVFHNRLWLFGGKVKVGSQDSFFANDIWYMAPDPGASFSGTPWSGVAPLTVQFTDDSTAEAAPISSWNWDFGDGTSSTEQSPSHTYTTRGIYTVSLTVTAGDFYNTDTEEDYITVTGEQHPFHTADQNQDNRISLSELLRVIQFYNSGGFHCQSGTEDGYAPGPGGTTACALYDSDYQPPDWKINLSEVLRVIQFFNTGGYHACEDTEDGFCPGRVPEQRVTDRSLAVSFPDKCDERFKNIPLDPPSKGESEGDARSLLSWKSPLDLPSKG